MKIEIATCIHVMIYLQLSNVFETIFISYRISHLLSSICNFYNPTSSVGIILLIVLLFIPFCCLNIHICQADSKTDKKSTTKAGHSVAVLFAESCTICFLKYPFCPAWNASTASGWCGYVYTYPLLPAWNALINPQCYCTWFVCVCVCVCVCVRAHSILLSRATYRTTRRTFKVSGSWTKF